jgi:putative two-component system response regulator
MLGTVDYMAPEQARDARSVDIRADIYGLGGILYWLLAGERPFPGDRSAVEELLARQHELPVPLRGRRPDVPLELEAIVCRMMALDASDRYSTPLALVSALDAFVEAHAGSSLDTRSDEDTIDSDPHTCVPHATPALPVAPGSSASRANRVLVVSARAACRDACRTAVETAKVECLEAVAAAEANDCLRRSPCDLVLVDAELPRGEGPALCSLLRRQATLPRPKVALVTSEETTESVADYRVQVADWDAPSSLCNVQSAIGSLLRLKNAEDRAESLATHLLETNQQLEQAVRVHDSDKCQAQEMLIFALVKLAESRGLESGAHLLRMQQYVRVLAEEAARQADFAGLVDSAFVVMIERCVALHDIGKVAIPDHILLKPGRLDPEERMVMEAHTVVGAGVLEAVGRHHGSSLTFLKMGIDIVRHHHERWDGTGYPDGLAGDAIPLAARLAAIVDAYDALRSKLVYKPGLTHAAARRLLLDASSGQFDPALLVAFRRSEASFEQIFEQTED